MSQFGVFFVSFVLGFSVVVGFCFQVWGFFVCACFVLFLLLFACWFVLF